MSAVTWAALTVNAAVGVPACGDYWNWIQKTPPNTYSDWHNSDSTAPDETWFVSEVLSSRLGELHDEMVYGHIVAEDPPPGEHQHQRCE